MLYMVTFIINIPKMLAYIPAPWILRVLKNGRNPWFPAQIFPSNPSPMKSKCQAAYSKRLFADNLDRHFEEVLGFGKSSPSMTELFR